MPLRHGFVSAKADGGDATVVRPSNWNADHVFSVGTPLRFVPLDEAYLISGSTAASAVALTALELTGIPANVGIVAVGSMIIQSTIASINSSFRVFNYASTTGNGQGGVVYPAVANQRFGSSWIASLGGTNERQIRYRVDHAGGGATITYWLMVTGYFTDDI